MVDIAVIFSGNISAHCTHGRPAPKSQLSIKDKICRQLNSEIYLQRTPFLSWILFFCTDFFTPQNFWMFTKMHFHLNSAIQFRSNFTQMRFRTELYWPATQHSHYKCISIRNRLSEKIKIILTIMAMEMNYHLLCVLYVAIHLQ